MNFLYRCLTSHSWCFVSKLEPSNHMKCLLQTDKLITILVDSSYFTSTRSQSYSSKAEGFEKKIVSIGRQQVDFYSDLTIFGHPILLNILTSPLLIPNMTNKPRYMSSSTKNRNATSGQLRANTQDQPCTNYNTTKNLSNTNSQHSPQIQSFNLIDNVNFKTMASVQKLVIEPTREHIENIRQILKHRNAKDNDDQTLTLEKDQDSGIGIIMIKSAAKNGISAKMMCDLLDIIDELYSWPRGKGVLIYGHNGFFCSGGDLISVRELANYEDGLKMATLMQYNLSRLQSLPMITMALIQGRALGGGAEIAVTTDLRVMTRSSRLGYVHCRVGIVAAWGGGSRLVQLIGPSRAVELMSSGRLVGADEALSFGLINSIIDDSDLDDQQVLEEAKKYLKSHLIGANSTIVAIKSLVNAARTLPLEQALVVEGQILSSTWGKQPHLEALNNNVKHRDNM